MSKKYPNFFIGLPQEFKHFLYVNQMDSLYFRCDWINVVSDRHIMGYDPEHSIVIFGDSAFKVNGYDYIYEYVRAKNIAYTSDQKEKQARWKIN